MIVHGKQANGTILITLGDQLLVVPDDATNGHREMIAAWEAEGNTIPEPPVLSDAEKRAAMPLLTARQFRLGLIEGGVDLAEVEAAIAAISDPSERQKAQVEWEYATQFERLHPLVVQVSSALDLTPEQVDAMWSAATSL